MIPLSAAVSSGFTFSEHTRSFELKLNDQIVGKLEQPRMWSPVCVASTPEENWTIRRSGFWGSRAEILNSVSQQPIATFKSGWGGRGMLTFADGQVFLVAGRGCWHPLWTVTTDAGQPVLQLHTREKSVEVCDVSALPQNRLSQLVLFTLYRVRQAEEAEAAADAAAS